jgi:DNA-binding NarL/FixJ family response regulator
MSLREEDIRIVSSVVSVWLVIADNRLRSELRRRLENDRYFQLRKCFSHWQQAMMAAKNPENACQHVTIVEGDIPGKREFEWFSALVEDGSRVIVLLDELDDKKLSVAIRSGVGGLLLNSSPLGQIVSAIRAVADGGIVMSPEVLKRIDPDVKQSDCKSNILTDRESSIVRLLAEGYSSRNIAQSLSISYLTVRTHIRNIQKKLGISSVAGLVSFSFKNDLS